MDDFAWLVSATVPDWSREELGRLEWSPGKQLLRAIRTYQRLVAAGVPRKLLLPWVAAHRYWSVVSGADIPLTVRIGGGLRLPHPSGVVIHPEVELGPNCQLMQQVTLGVGSRPGLPQLGGHVDVGAGARVLGGVRVGDHVQIGANAVVLDDVPTGATVVGIPARIVRRRSVPEAG
ncbi:MAG: serine acetyltransferase [Myxococcota bacterium]|jgi:serine O-acetyltransferase|nr:serine acetyltransferase [Myxococcota bacterium]